MEGGASEPLLLSFVADKAGIVRVKEIRGAQSKKRYLEQALEPELMTYLFDEEREKRRRVRFEEIPDHLVKAVLAIEDRRFFSHPGVDPLALMARAFRNIRSDSAIPYGGSTVTQQLCKNFFLTQVDERGYRVAERSYRRKAQEALLAFVLERRASKQAILELYLNGVYLGQSGSFGVYGVGEAARIYFRKDVANLTLPESALLAGMIQSPNPYNPFRHEKRATERRNEVIRAMQDAGFIGQVIKMIELQGRQFLRTLVHRLDGIVGLREVAAFRTCTLKRLHIAMGHLLPDHVPPKEIRALAHGVALRLVFEEIIDLVGQRIRIPERHQHAPFFGQHLLGVPIGR